MYGMRLFDATIKALHCCIPGSSGGRRRGALQISRSCTLHGGSLSAFHSGKRGSGGQQELPYIIDMANSLWLCSQEGEKPLDMTCLNTLEIFATGSQSFREPSVSKDIPPHTINLLYMFIHSLTLPFHSHQFGCVLVLYNL